MTLANKPHQALPANSFPLGTSTHDAYEQCIRLEQQTGWDLFENNLERDYSEPPMRDLSPVIVARVLGHALRLAPSSQSCDALTQEIIGCEGNPELLAGLGHLYIYGLIRAFYNPTGPTPSISAIQSPGNSFGEAVGVGSYLLRPWLVTTRELRQLTLIRDEYACVFTGSLSSDLDGPALDAALELDPDRHIIRTQVAHGISQSLSSDIGGMTDAAREKFKWASSASAILERFGGFSAHAILGGDNLNSPHNALTASHTSHFYFDCLDLWLVPAKDNHGVVIPDTYDVRHALDPRKARLFKERIRFRTAYTPDGTGNAIAIPPPHPRILALHAACAQIAHMSGAAGHMADFYSGPDQGGISVMTEPSAQIELVRRLKILQLSGPAGEVPSVDLPATYNQVY